MCYKRTVKVLCAAILFALLCLVSSPKSYGTISFTISNPTINSDDSIVLTATVSGLISSSCSTSGCYLQSELQVADGSKSYFGYTYNNSGEFVDYFSPSSTDDIKSKLFNFVPVSGAWTGQIEAKNNNNDLNYAGPGQYTLKFRRFSGNSTSPTTGDSNALTVTLSLALPTPTPTATPIPTAVPTATPTSAPTATKTPTVPPKPSSAASSSGSLSATDSADVLSAASMSAPNDPSPFISKPFVKEVDSVKSPNNTSKVALGTGVVLVSSCVILLFRQMKG